MRTITLEELLEAGCHFGHQVNRRNPKADEFIFEERSNVHIINLEKTREGLLAGADFVKDVSSKGGYLIIVGTKRQSRTIVKEEVERARAAGTQGLFYVTSRWIGGILTNFHEVSKNVKRLGELNNFLSTEEKKSQYTKREILLFERERNKLKDLYEGIVGLDRLPNALYIIDTHHEHTAVHEADIAALKTVGVVDTNADPRSVTYPIPANDDAVGSVKIITTYLVDAWIEGQKVAKKEKTEKNENEEVTEKKAEKKKTTKAKKVTKEETPIVESA